MDFSFRAIHDVVHATAAFSEEVNKDSDSDLASDRGDYGQGYDTPSSGEEDDIDPMMGKMSGSSEWLFSQLNPKNRIDSIAPLAYPLWRIDGAAGFATQFYAYPLFLKRKSGPPPMHLDVFIEEQSAFPPFLRDVLDMNRAFHTKDATRVRRLGIANYILRILQYNTLHPNGELKKETVEFLYKNGPFGSRVVLRNFCCHLRKVRVTMSPNYPLEGDLMSYKALKEMWRLADGDGVGDDDKENNSGKKKDKKTKVVAEAKTVTRRPLPPEISILNVRLIRQLHDSISLVEVYPYPVTTGMEEEEPKKPKGSHHKKAKKDKKDKKNSRDKNEFDDVVETSSFEPEIVILKSLSSSVKYMYQELRALLVDIPPHDGVLTQPLHVITKECLFGNKMGVIGFTMPYYEAGSLRDTLPLLRIHGQLNYTDQLRWAYQITEAMCHVWHKGNGFYYPDLRLDNVVLTAPAPVGNAGLVDFEQRGVWCSFSAPEVDYIESLRVIAFDDQEDFEYNIPDNVCFQYKQRLIVCYEAAITAKALEEFGGLRLPAPPPSASKLGRHPLVRLEEDTKYSNPKSGYNVAYNCLTKSEQEAAMVYMLGRLLWCIFEGMSAPHRGAVWMSYPREPELEFPAFRLTPPHVQTMILKCFGDVGAQEQSKFMRQNGKIYMKGDPDTPGGSDDGDNSSATLSPTYGLVGDNLPFNARDYWQVKLAEGEEWLRKRNMRIRGIRDIAGGATLEPIIGGDENAERNPDGSTMEKSAHGRPTLRQVLRWLEILQRELPKDEATTE
ncbi:hypothetical protein Sste5346_000728 [Sporothrix stenoceras]|uniref:Protein kinase domain-containing protein n=1 Tax=Sporothrix stenoceras TaxID=5173 RepID=A0ABR3ZRK8_9PEZI